MDGIASLRDKQKKLVQLTQEYMKTKNCRWAFLLKAFGFAQGDNFRCGKCDNCQ